MLKLSTTAYCIIVFALVSCSAWCYNIGDPAAPIIQVAPMSSAPTIDGKIGQDEWKGTAATNAIHEMGSIIVVPNAPTVRIGYDKSYLYIAAVVPISPEQKIKAQSLVHDGPAWSDDAIEIFLDPRLNKDSYQFLANSIGSMTELKNQDLTWNGEWQAAGSQNDKSWNIEIRIAWSSLGIDSIKAGMVLGLNIGFDVTSPISHAMTWAPLTSGAFHQPERFGHLVLAPDGPSVAAISSIDEKSLGFEIGSGSISSILKVSNDALVVGTQTLDGQGRVACDLPLKDGKPDYADYKWELSVVGKDSGTTIYRQSGISKVSAMLPLSIALRKYFLQGKLAVDIDASGLKIDDQPLKYIGTISDQAGKQITSEQMQMISNRVATIVYDVSRLDNSKHTLKIEAFDAKGNQLATNQADFVVPSKPEWLGSKAGISDKVLSPWGPLKTRTAKGQITVAPDGRVYSFSSSPLPDSVVTAGASIFAGPVTMKLSVDGQKTLLKGQLKVIKKTPAQVVLQGTALAGSLKVDSTVTIDFDGNAWVALNVHGNQDVTIDSFIIEAPVKKKHAKYRYYYPGAWGSSENARALEPAGWGAVYVPYIWLGDDDRGFALYSTSDQNWNNKPDFKAVQVLPAGPNTMNVRFSVITEPLKLSAIQASSGLKYTFGFEATPNKKPDKDVWDYRIIHAGSYELPYSYTTNNTKVKYTGEKSIDLARGTLDMWVKVRFDPDAKWGDYNLRGNLNKDLLLITSGDKKFGVFWCIDDRGMRFYTKTGEAATLVLGARNEWKENEFHHIMVTWGDEICLYVDGQLTVKNQHAGLIPETPGTTAIELTASNPGFDIDELRISNIERKPEVPDSAYVADANTLLLDHFDRTRKVKDKISTTPVKGNPGVLQGAVGLEDGKFKKALVCTEKSIPTLEYMKKQGIKTLVFHESWAEYESYPETIKYQEQLKTLVKACHEQGIQLLLYFGYLMADICPEWDPYHLEVLVMPQQGEFIREPMQKDYSVCYSSAWQDFLADGIDKVMAKYDIDGVYLDGTSWPWLCNNTEHGCGYKKPDGTISGTYSISGAREMVRRIYTIVKSHKPDGQVNIHNSTTMVIPTLGWATSTWDGEQFGSIGRGANLDNLFPMDTFRAEFMGRQWGPPAELLCYDTPYTTHEAFSFSLLHDVLVRGSGHWVDEESGLWKAMELFGRKQAQFKPYWNNSDLAKVTGSRCYTSLYVRPGKGVMCVVSNLDKDPRHVKVNLNLKKMGLTPNVTATNAITGDKITIKNGVITISLNTFDYQLIWVK